MSPGPPYTTLIIVPANSISFLETTVHKSTTRRKTYTRPLQLQRLTMVSSANATRDQCCWFQFWCPCANVLQRRQWSGISLGTVLLQCWNTILVRSYILAVLRTGIMVQGDNNLCSGNALTLPELSCHYGLDAFCYRNIEPCAIITGVFLIHHTI